MGALTLKSFPFELRGWDIEKFESIDPTDGFGSDTRVYISNQVVQIEPDYNIQTFNTWLTDKADSSLMEYSRLGHLMKVTSQPLKIHG
jgi:NADH dehydrogenase/NADH:ubiquinone oxidoreductase subunit G